MSNKSPVSVLYAFQMLLFKASSNQVLEREYTIAVHYTGCDY